MIVLFLFVLLASTTGQEDPNAKICIKEPIKGSDVLFFQFNGMIRTPDVEQNYFKPTNSRGVSIDALSISIASCMCPDERSLGCAEIGVPETMATGWPVVLSHSAVAIGGTVRFMLSDASLIKPFSLFNVDVAGTGLKFMPLLSWGPESASRLTFPDNLFTETSPTWSFGICLDSKLSEGEVAFRLCYIFKPVEVRLKPLVPVVFFPFDDSSVEHNLDISQDIVTFIVSKNGESKIQRFEGLVHVKLVRPRGVSGKSWEITNSTEVLFPTLSEKSVLHIGFQSARGIPSQFDSFWGTNSTEFARSPLLHARHSWASNLCLDQFSKFGERCQTTTTESETTTTTTTESDPPTTTPSSDPDTESTSNSEQEQPPSDSMVVTTVGTDVLVPSELISADHGGGLVEKPLDWISIVLFVGGGVLLVIGAVIIFLTLNRRQN
jgi:hypothetical protein